jgi:hypothetical protein
MQDDHGIGGAHNRVAGRDYYENPVIVQAPQPSRRPGLVACPACDREGLSPAALICPDCGHDLTLERRLQHARRLRRRNACMATVVAAGVTGVNLHLRTHQLLGDVVFVALGMLWLVIALLWFQHWILARA